MLKSLRENSALSRSLRWGSSRHPDEGRDRREREDTEDTAGVKIISQPVALHLENEYK